MDPLSIVCGTSALVGQTAKVVKVLYELHGTLKDAPLLLSSIMTECSVVRTTLCALQDMQNQKSSRTGRISEQIFNSFSMAVACCELILADLEKDAQTCLRAGKDPGDKDAVRSCQIILSKDHLQDLLTQLRGQSQAITLLLTTWRSRNEEQMRQHEEANREVLRGIARRVMRRYTESQTSSQESQSITSFDRFDFDQQLLSAPCYQRAMHYLRKMESRHTELRGLTPEPQTFGLGIRCPPEDHESGVLTSPADLDSPYRQSQQESTKMPETPTINLSYHSQDQTRLLAQELSKNTTIHDNHTDDFSKQGSFMSKRKSMPPLYSQIQAVATSPNSLLGVVARAQRHRRSRSEGTEAMLTSSPMKRTILSPSKSISRDSAIVDADLALQSATKEDFNAYFDEFWVLQHYRERYRSSSIPTRKIVFLGDPCVRPLWSTVRAAPLDSENNDDGENGNVYGLSIAIDDVNFDLRLVDMTGDHEDFAASLLEPEAHIAVVVYTIENSYSLRDVLRKWAPTVQDIYPTLPMYILGWGPEVRDDAHLNGWLNSMGQKSVTYDEGAAAFHHLQAEAYLEIGAQNERDAVDLFEALSKTSIHLYHEELQGRTPVGSDLETNRFSQPNPLSFGELLPPKFTILPGLFSRGCRTDLLHELDATPKTESDGLTIEVVAPIEHKSRRSESQKPFYDESRKSQFDLEDIRASKSDFGSLLDVQTEPDEVDTIAEHESRFFTSTDDSSPYYKAEVQQEKATVRMPVVLRIDTGLPGKQRPRIIEISKPQHTPDEIESDDEPELPDWETCLQQYFLQYPESQEVSFATIVGSPNIHVHSMCQTEDLIEIDDDEANSIKIPGSIPQFQDSPYVLPDLPEFESLTPKLMGFLFGTASEEPKDYET